jgi:hypothetical protein
MSPTEPLEKVSVGVVVERSKATGVWVDFLWRPVAVLAGVPDTPAWTKLTDDGERATFYAGAAEIELYRSEAAHYRDNLLAEPPLLWIALNPAEGEPPFGAPLVTADPAEGESFTGTPDAVVDSVPMPDVIREWTEAFVAVHYVDRAFNKRRRDRANLEGLGRREPKPVRPTGETS